MLHSFKLAIAGLFFSIGSLFAPAPQQNLSGINFTPVQVQKTQLSASGIGISDVTIGLTSLRLPDGSTAVTMANFGNIGYGTLEPATSKEEQISFTGITQNANGSATLTGVTRGLRFVYPYDSVSANRLTHAGGSTFVISNTSAFYYNQFVLKNSDGTIASVLTFASTSPPVYDASLTQTNPLALVSVGQLNATAFQGSATATQNILGLVSLATLTQQAAGTASTSLGNPLVLQSKNANATYDGSKSNQVVVTGNANQIDSNYIATSSNYTWTGGHTFVNSTTTNATTTSLSVSGSLRLNGVSYRPPQAIVASSTFLTTDASGNQTWDYTNWDLIGETIATSSQNTLNINNFPARNSLYINAYVTGKGGSINATNMRFNNDTTAVYKAKNSTDFGSFNVLSGTQFNNFDMNGTGTTSPVLIEMWIDNVTAASTTAPKLFRATLTGAEPNTSPSITTYLGNYGGANRITSISFDSNGGTWNTGTRFSVYGSRN